MKQIKKTSPINKLRDKLKGDKSSKKEEGKDNHIKFDMTMAANQRRRERRRRHRELSKIASKRNPSPEFKEREDKSPQKD